MGLRRKLYLLEIGGRQRRPDRQAGQDVMTASPVSMPSHSPRAAPALMGASRTAPPATLPNIMRGFETEAFSNLSGAFASNCR